MKPLKKMAVSDKISISREILRNNELNIMQYIVHSNEPIRKSDIINHLKNDLREESIVYHLVRLEKLKIVQIQEEEEVSEARCSVHPEADDFVRAFLALLFH